MSSEKPSGEPLLVHDRSLTNKVAAGSEAGEIVDQQILQLGAQLVTQLHVLLRVVRSHGPGNSALDRPLGSIQTLVRALGNDQPVALRLQEGFVFLGERHLKTTSQQLTLFVTFFEALLALGVGGIALKSNVTAGDLRRFAELFVGLQPDPSALDELRTELAEANIETIVLEAPRTVNKESSAVEAMARAALQAAAMGDGATAPGEPPKPGEALRSQTRERSRSVYAQASSSLARLNEGARAHGRLSFRQAKRAIQNIVDLLLKDPATVLGLSTLRTHDEYTQNHSVNVALLAMALGNRAGYPKIALADLGLAALFHDIGKCAVPLEVLNKSTEFTAEEWDVMRTHPSEGVLALVGQRTLRQVPLRMAAASFEHHLNHDGTGYPKLSTPWKQTLSSRVIAIADCYDAMTSARVYRRVPMPPPSVLSYMLTRSGTLFDPALLKHFVTCVGIIPIGTMVLLDTGELAVVLRPAAEREHAQRPVVKVISDSLGAPIEPPAEHDLQETDADGRYLRSIIRLVDNTEHRLETSKYVAG